MLNTKIDLPLGKTGLTASLSVLEAFAASAAIKTVIDGGILRFDAVKGFALQMEIDAENTEALDNGKVIDIQPDKWYGILRGAKLLVGPYDRKSQAMNALGLTILNISTTMSTPEEIEQGKTAFNEARGVIAEQQQATKPASITASLNGVEYPAIMTTDKNGEDFITVTVPVTAL